MESLEKFRQIAEMPLRNWSQVFPDRRPIGMYNAYVPEELFHAAGLTPVYVFHQSADRGHTRTHLPSFACWPSRSLVDQALSGELDGLAGMTFSQTCDTVQALTDIWRKALPCVPVYHFGMPVNLAAPAARKYLIAELNHLRSALGNPADDALFQACAVHNRTRELVTQLYDRAGDLKPTDLCAILRSALLMPKEALNESLEALMEQLPAEGKPGPRLVLVGPHLCDPTLYQVIENAGARVVDDLLDVGHRHFEPLADVGDHPIPGLADRLLAAVPTPTKHRRTHSREKYLIQRVAQVKADGVIFARQKFCDPHGFDYANMIAFLDASGIPHLLIDLEQASQLGQMHTRVEAFLETIGP